ncbi:hypothetical protein AVEN_252201-1 [Araneus ventricosus]|uniref:ATP-dependent DNA helicase n=1 Tax=Araneus ventricosus TaxID=182803 RepID=A0A4Y2QY75_ARAVE|nr:hypothetical protein AVEN_252201-1 [Araneus ventricosus]
MPAKLRQLFSFICVFCNPTSPLELLEEFKSYLCEGGRTAHSRFKLPVPILDNSSCSIRHNTEDGRFLKAAKLLIWDELTMTPHHALSAVDRLLRYLMNSDLPFGGKVFVLGGDWRQILPVAVHTNYVMEHV